MLVFTANRREAATIKASLKEQGHDVAYIQDMQTLKEEGITRIVLDMDYIPKEDDVILFEMGSLASVLLW